MPDENQRQDDLAYDVALNLLPSLGHSISIRLTTPQDNQSLLLEGTLLTAFDTPSRPSITTQIGEQTASIRLTHITSHKIATQTNQNHQQKIKIQLLLDNQTQIEIQTK